MSLINDMLRDLDKRRARSLERPDGALHNLDLGAAGDRGAPRVALYLLATVIGLGALIGAGYFAWQHLGSALPSRPSLAASDVRAGARTDGGADKGSAAERPPAKPALAPTPPASPAVPAAVATSAPDRTRASAVPAKTRARTSAKPSSSATASRPASAARTKAPAAKDRSQAAPAPSSADAAARGQRSASGSGDGQMQKHRRPMTPAQRSELAYRQGYRLIAKGDTERGEARLRAALKADAHNLQARELLSGVYIRAGRLVEAAGLLQQGVHLAPKHTVFAQLYARVLIQQGKAPAAVTVLEQHLPAARGDVDYLAMLAALYQRVDRQRQAARVYRQLVQERPGRGNWWAGLGISLEALGKPAAAREAYQHARQTGTLSPALAKYTRQRLSALKSGGSQAD